MTGAAQRGVRGPSLAGAVLQDVGARHAGYYRHYRFGGAGGGYQQFWLSHNALGAGNFDGVTGRYSSGIYADQDAGGAAPHPSKITANTLTILSPTSSIDPEAL